MSNNSNNSNRISVRFTPESLQVVEQLKSIMGDTDLVGISPVTNFALSFAHDAMKKIVEAIHPGIRMTVISIMNGHAFGNIVLEKQMLPNVLGEGMYYDPSALEHLIRAGLDPFEAIREARQWDDVTRTAVLYDVIMFWQSAGRRDWQATLSEGYNSAVTQAALTDDQVINKMEVAMQKYKDLGFS